MDIENYTGKQPKQKFELMYRQPGLPEHQNITDVMDEIILKLREIDQRLTSLENKHGTDFQ